MLVGVHLLRDHPRDFDEGAVHSCIYSVSAIAGTVIMIIALYNGYHTRYHRGLCGKSYITQHNTTSYQTVMF